MNFSFFTKKEKKQENIDETNKNTEKNSELKDISENILTLENIQVGLESVTKKKAIEMAGQLLVDGGYVRPEYIAAMQEREKLVTTYIGEGVAIPHGVGAAKEMVIKSGISVLQFPEGVIFEEGKVAFLVVGIAGKGNEHMEILTRLAELIQEGDTFKELFITKNKAQVYNAFTHK